MVVLKTPLNRNKPDGVCRGRGVQHVFRFNRYAGPFNYAVHPSDPDRFPKKGVFRCTECGDEIICHIKHRK